MDKKQNLIPLQELNLTSRFLFDEVLEDPQIHQDVLGIIFQRDIPLLEKNETEKELRVSPLLRSIRMDVFSMDEEKAVYNTEMQQKRRADLAKRSRYYQSLVDAGLLEPGVPDYNRLNTSYIISTDSQRIKRIHRRVRKVRLSEEVGVKYMQAWEEKYYEREEGAHNKLRELAAKKYRKGMSVKEIAELLEESETTVQELLKESEMR